jgi:hypothetical protein
VPGIFLSYSRETLSAAKVLADDIEKLGYAAWLDQDLSGGKAWWDQILAQIRECEIFVLALSPESVRSTACSRESGYAEALGKPILPVMVADGVGVLPARLSKIHYVDYRKRDIDTHADLVRALMKTPPAGALPQPLPEPPAIPLSYLESIAEQIDAAAQLGSKDQSDIVSQLRGGLDDPETAAGARELLARLNKRSDLLARTGREIDALLRGALQPGGQLPPPPDRVPAPLPPPPGTNIKSLWSRTRLIAGFLGATIGGPIGLVAVWIDYQDLALAISPAVAGAMVGVISQSNIRVIGCAVAGAMLALVPFFVVVPAQEPDALSVATIIFMPIGAVIGAVLGAIARKMRKWP